MIPVHVDSIAALITWFLKGFMNSLISSVPIFCSCKTFPLLSIAHTYNVPIFFNTFTNPIYPTQDELEKGIKTVDTELRSPYDKMGLVVSNELLNGDFIRYAADKYTGNCYKDWFEDEPTAIHRWFTKEDTKGSLLQGSKNYIIFCIFLKFSISSSLESMV